MEVIISEKAAEYAIKCHTETNHKYNDKPYTYHLEEVVNVCLRFVALVPEEDHQNVISACWCHDVIEDCRQTFNNVKQATNLEVAEIVYALTNEKGKNRKERANDKYYEGIRKTPNAVFVKLCDRIANIEYSKAEGSSMFAMYQKENKEFIKSIYDSQYLDMFFYLKMLVN